MSRLFTDEQLRQISIIERLSSVLFLSVSLLIIITFIFFKGFQKPINRLAFYASFGNALTNVSTLMSRAYVDQEDSVGCQMQAFLIQEFMPADTLWTLAMAVNVWLAFYHRFDAAMLRKLELPYLVGCYGVPLALAIACLFVRNKNNQRPYGDAVLWCWIDEDWGIWRVASLYAPIWIAISITIFIYSCTGYTIYKQRREFPELMSSDTDLRSSSSSSNLYDGSKTTEITVISEDIESLDHPIERQRHGTKVLCEQIAVAQGPGVYSVTISANRSFPSSPPDAPRPMKPSHARSLRIRIDRFNPLRPPLSNRLPNNNPHDRAVWAYTKCAVLFFTAMLITWIPSSANRVYSFVHANDTSAALQYMSAFVLPLQGFWNGIVYIVTSRNAFKDLITQLSDRFSRLRRRFCFYWTLHGRVGRRTEETRPRTTKGEAKVPRSP